MVYFLSIFVGNCNFSTDLAKCFFEKMIVSQTREPPRNVFFCFHFEKWNGVSRVWVRGSVTQSLFKETFRRGVARVSRDYDTFIFENITKNTFAGPSRGFRGYVTHSFFRVQNKKLSRRFRGFVTQSFFSKKDFAVGSRVYDTFIFQSAKQKKLSRGFADLWHNHFSKKHFAVASRGGCGSMTYLFFKVERKNISRGFRGSMTHSFFQSAKQKKLSRVCDTIIFSKKTFHWFHGSMTH